ncbi:hypothetical protein LUZ60_015427 [Juncus effusus]|nr:hypothetical protein LUZ60_015427 [Juncus effusus]
MEPREKKREKGAASLSHKGFLFLVFLFLFSLSFLTIACAKCPHLVNKDRRSMTMRPNAYIEDIGRKPIRRRLSAGPGSYPPRCSYKCGRCTPCNPVHVPVPPGRTMFFPTEYYPEAWRCKCGNRLYMP